VTADLGIATASLLLLALLSLGLIGISATERDPRMASLYRQLFILAMVLRFAASIALYGFGFVGIIGDEDASGWEGAAAIFRDWSSRGVTLGDLPIIWVEAFRHPLSLLGYQYTVASLFFLTGAPSRLVAAVLNNFCGAMTVVLAARVGAAVFSPWVASRVGWSACLWPSLVVWSAQTVKEPIVIFLETVALYACIRLRSPRGRPAHVLACAVAIVMLATLRFYAAYVTIAVILLTLSLPNLRSGRSRVGAALAVSAVVLPVLVLTGALARHEAALQIYDLGHLQEIRDWTARHTDSGVPLDYALNTPSGMALSVGIGTIHLLLAPFPWELGDAKLRTLLTLPELVIWWWMVFRGLLPGLRIAVRNRFTEVQPLLYFVLGMAFLYGLTFSNVGLVFRQRAQLLPWLLVFTMVGFEQRAARKLAFRKSRSVVRMPVRRPIVAERAQT
jgi:hypothetical protein